QKTKKISFFAVQSGTRRYTPVHWACWACTPDFLDRWAAQFLDGNRRKYPAIGDTPSVVGMPRSGHRAGKAAKSALFGLTASFVHLSSSWYITAPLFYH